VLEKKYFELSRVLHPDRFSAKGSQARLLSIQRMSLVNEAYRTLKDPTLRRNYLLQLLGAPPIPKDSNSLPIALSESWFELQDQLSPHPPEAVTQLELFEQNLLRDRQARAAALQTREEQFDNPSTPAPQKQALLQEIAKEEMALNYIRSLEKDIVRVKKRFISP